ncbi:hypothetical protein [Cellulomonas sp. WB94]|nr:hypothetical protein [Cellulomonas sp. WB94]
MSGRRNRYREIVETMTRYGWGFLLGAVGPGLRSSLGAGAHPRRST